MMYTIKILPSFLKSVRNLSEADKEKIKGALEKFNDFLIYGNLTKGLGLKKLIRDVYEIRADIKIRIIIKTEGNIIYIVLAGTHQGIKEYLKRYR